MSLFLFSLRETQYTFRGFNYWIISTLLVSFAYILLAMRASVPAFVGIILPNIFFVLAGFVKIHGLDIFFKNRVSKRQNTVSWSILIIFAGLISFFTYIKESMYIRTLIDALIITPLCIYTGVLIWTNKPQKKHFTYILTASLFFISGTLFIVRILGWILIPSTRHIFANSAFNNIQFVPNLVIDMTWSFMFFVIHNQKLTHELKSSEERFRSIFNNSIFGILLIDYDGKYLNINPAYTKITGYDKEDILEKPIGSITHHEDINKVRQALIDLHTSSKTHYSDQIRIIHKNGNTVWIQMNATANFKPNNAFDYVLVEFIDITQQHNAESALKQSETRLKQMNSTKDKLYSIMAHDLRSPFSSIMGFSELMVENYASIDKERALEYLKIINSQSKNTLALLDNLLIWAKSQIGQIEFKPNHHRLLSIVQELLSVLDSSAKFKDINLNYHFREDLMVFADRNMLYTVFRNLVANAIKFTKNGGSVSVKAKPQPDHIEISISDTGIGMNEEIRNNLFRMEANIETKGVKNELGSGLGLIICKEFVEKHEGEIWVESEPGKGSDFKFKLPIRQYS